MKSLSLFALTAILIAANLQAAGTLTVVSAATNLSGPLAPESIATAFGNLANGAQVDVTDSAGISRSAIVFYTSPAQANFQIPPGTALGPAIVSVTLGDGTALQSNVDIAPVSPGFFPGAADLVVTADDGSQTISPLFYYCVKAACFTAPISLGPAGSQTALVLFGTGIRGRTDLSNVSCTLGGVTPARILYAGPSPGFIGLDQVNIAIPPDLSNAGEVSIACTIDSQPAKAIPIDIIGPP